MGGWVWGVVAHCNFVDGAHVRLTTVRVYNEMQFLSGTKLVLNCSINDNAFIPLDISRLCVAERPTIIVMLCLHNHLNLEWTERAPGARRFQPLIGNTHDSRLFALDGRELLSVIVKLVNQSDFRLIE